MKIEQLASLQSSSLSTLENVFLGDLTRSNTLQGSKAAF